MAVIIGEVIGWLHFTARAEQRHTMGRAAVSKQARAASQIKAFGATTAVPTAPANIQTPAAEQARSAAVQETLAAVHTATASQRVSVRI